MGKPTTHTPLLTEPANSKRARSPPPSKPTRMSHQRANPSSWQLLLNNQFPLLLKLTNSHGNSITAVSSPMTAANNSITVSSSSDTWRRAEKTYGRLRTPGAQAGDLMGSFTSNVDHLIFVDSSFSHLSQRHNSLANRLCKKKKKKKKKSTCVDTTA